MAADLGDPCHRRGGVYSHDAAILSAIRAKRRAFESIRLVIVDVFNLLRGLIKFGWVVLPRSALEAKPGCLVTAPSEPYARGRCE